MLILDEPTSDLDLVLAKHIWQLIKKINKKGTTIIVASHDLPEVESICDRIGVLANGKLNNIGTVEQLKHMISKGQEIHVETYPGDYEKIMKKFKDPLIIEMENRGSSLVIHTKKPDKILAKLLERLEKLDEALLDVKITKLSLKDVFTKITKKKK
jgi:ABC-2 type transport system ATP-binding protein